MSATDIDKEKKIFVDKFGSQEKNVSTFYVL